MNKGGVKRRHPDDAAQQGASVGCCKAPALVWNIMSSMRWRQTREPARSILHNSRQANTAGQRRRVKKISSQVKLLSYSTYQTFKCDTKFFTIEKPSTTV